MTNPLDKEKLKANGSFCLYPFVHLSTVPSGFVRPCCYSEDFLSNPDDSNKKYNVVSSSLEECWNGSHLRSIRRDMIEGRKVEGCKICYAEETNSSSSMRHRSFHEWERSPGVWTSVLECMQNDFFVSEPPRFLEIKPGSLCNLRCRMCNQFDSISVAREMEQISKKFSSLQIKTQSRLLEDHDMNFDVGFDISQMPDWSKLPEFWEALDKTLPSLEQLSFAGGEPTLLPEVHQLIRRCVETGHSKHIKVLLASNFTNLKAELLELAPKFKRFEFIASIDGTAGVQEYIRAPSKWNEVKANFEQAFSGTTPGSTKVLVNLTLQMYNALSFTDVLDWLESLDHTTRYFWEWPYNINILFHPRYLSIDYLPPEARRIAGEKIAAYRSRSKFLRKFPGMDDRFKLLQHKLNEATPPDYQKVLGQFWRFTSILDRHRGHSLRSVDPVLHDLVESELKKQGFDTNEDPFGG